MTADGPHSRWMTDAIKYLSNSLPAECESGGWEHACSSAYQMGCEALVALGHAEETDWGAVPRETPRLPSVLPRWDDVCTAILGLARQRHEIEYRLPDGSILPPWWVRQRSKKAKPRPTPNIAATDELGPLYASPETLSAFEAQGLVADGRWTNTDESLRLQKMLLPKPTPPPNIAAIDGLGLAYVTLDVVPVLQQLGLVANDRWTEAAETVLWRKRPEAWGLDFTSDPRFANAVEQALETMPEDIRVEMDQAMEITDAHVAAAVARSEARHKGERAKYGHKAEIAPPFTTEQARSVVVSGRQNGLNWLFFRRWRLPDGWLTPKEAERALAIFHDPLAIAMRRVVAQRLYPDLPFLADYF